MHGIVVNRVDRGGELTPVGVDEGRRAAGSPK